MAELITLARPYAKAVFRLAQQTNTLMEWSTALQALALISLHPQVQALQRDPRTSIAQRIAFYEQVASNYLSVAAKSLLEVLAQNRRLNILAELAALFEKFKAEALSELDVRVMSAVELTVQQQQRLSEKLEKVLGKKIHLHCHQDPTLVGGAVIRAGDKVIDGSMRGKLYQMAESLGA